MDNHFDVVVLGTGLQESITAAALAKAGVKVLHIDANSYYGGNEASLTSNELLGWAEDARKVAQDGQAIEFFVSSVSEAGPSNSRAYSLSLSPSIIPATGSLIASLVGSGVSRYGEFKLLQKVSVFLDGAFKSVPGGKEDIFKSKDLSLIDKRKLMRFLTFASGEFEQSNEMNGREDIPFCHLLKEVFQLNDLLCQTIAYALALCSFEADTTLPSLTRLRHFLRSSGRYGPSPFLVGLFGGLGEISQGFCRASAVSGGTYMLKKTIKSITSAENKGFQMEFNDLPELITADLVISSTEYRHHLTSFGNTASKEQQQGLHDRSAHAIVVIDSNIALSSFSSTPTDGETKEASLDTGLLVFPPSQLSRAKAVGAVSVLINGEGVASCPRGQSVLYVSTPLSTNDPPDAEKLLQPYLDATLSSFSASTESRQPNVLFKTFYSRSSAQIHKSSLDEDNVIICAPLLSHVAENGDDAAKNAEDIFRRAMKRLANDDGDLPFWPPLQTRGDDDVS